MYTVKLIPKAEKELIEACAWYEEQRPGLGTVFFNKIGGRLKSIENNPFHYNIRFSGRFRFAPVTVFPYMVVYKVDELEKTIYVISVFHTSRNPAKF